jgi:hypothetical protein
MNPFKPLIVFSILIIALFSSCSEQDESPDLKGDIIGYAFCFDEYGIRLEDCSGIQVFTEPDRKYSAVTDKHGNYELKNVKNGTYNLSFEKEGFGTMKMFGILHSGRIPTIVTYYGSDDVAPFLYKPISTQITHTEFRNDSVIAGFKFSGDYIPERMDMSLFISSYENFNLLSAELMLNAVLWAEGPNYVCVFDGIMQSLPYTSGETVYCKAAIYSFCYAVQVTDFLTITGISTYFQGSTTVYPNLSNEPYEFSFTMP